MADEIVIVVRGEDQFSNVLGNVGSIITGIESAINLVGQAFDAAVGFVQPFIDSASESEQAVARLNGVLRATGGAVGMTSEELQGMADNLQQVTMFSDETILAGESMLLTFRNIGEETFQRTVPAMLDMASIFGSVDSAALQLGKALNDPLTGISALQRVGVTFSEQQREQIANFMEMGDIASAQGVILSELEAQVGGLAEEMGNTFAGRMEILRNRFDSLKESVGMFIIDALSPLMEGIEDFVFNDWFQNFINFFGDLSRYAQAGVEPLAAIGYALNNMAPATHEIAMYFLQLQNILREGGGIGDIFNEIFSPENLQAVGEAFTNFTASIDWNAISNRIADGISSIDWGRVGNIISQALGYLAIGIGNILGNIDWSALLNSMGNAIADLIGGLFGFIDWEDMVASAEVGFRYVGQSIVDGLRTGLLMAWTNFTNLPTMLFNNFITSVKAVLGISSPSAVFASIGRDIVMGLIGGFVDYWDNLITIAQNSLDDFLNMFGIDLSFGGSSASGLGTAGGGTSGGGTGTGGTSGEVHNYYYGPVYFMGAGEPGAYYDCPAPNPFMTAGSQTVMPNGVH